MRYWDASALAPLVVAEPSSGPAQSWLSEDSQVVTWAWTRVELTSAVERRVREGALNRRDRRMILERLSRLAATWDEVIDVLAVRSRAMRLLGRHPLRASDAGQLAAALLVSEHVGGDLPFVCLDARLSLAADREGLATLPQPFD